MTIFNHTIAVMKLKLLTLSLLLLLIVGAMPLKGQIFVSLEATGNQDGTSWNNAFINLNTAIESATVGDEIWVATGIYTNSGNSGFVLSNGITIYGGFIGTESNVDERDWESNPTILSGDVLQDDVLDSLFLNKTDNNLHVVFADTEVDNTTVLDGFIIENGFAAESSDQINDIQGAGLFCFGSPNIRNSIFRQNIAVNGGGIAALSSFSDGLILENVLFENNRATTDGGALILNGFETNSTFIECTFNENHAQSMGGAIAALYVSPQFLDCSFNQNTANLGGALWATASTINPLTINLTNTHFTENSSPMSGGALYFEDNVRSAISSCNFTMNIAEQGGALFSLGDSLGVFQSNFTNNSANFGGAIYTQTSFFNSVTESFFVENDAETHGGAIYLDNSVMNIQKTTFSDNEAENAGGAIYASEFETVVINSIFENNNANNGGALMSDNGNFTSIIHSLFWGNDASNLGPAVSIFNNSAVALTNSLLWSNIGIDINQVFTNNNSNLLLNNCLIQGLNVAENINMPPLLTDPTNGDYTPTANSPAINAGDDQIANSPSDDYDGNPRDNLPDIGPFEFQFDVPNAPSGLIATVLTPFEIQLTWEDNADLEDAYIVERSIGDPNAFVILANLPPNATSYNDIGLSPGITYFYRVRSRKLQLFSPYSNIAEATPPVDFPDAPTNLLVTAFDASSVSLVWNDNSSDEIAFVLERAVGTGSSFEVLDENIGANTTVYEDLDLMAGFLYTYRVKARSVSGDSEYSNAVVVSIPPITGIADVSLIQLKTFPNPTSDFLNIKWQNDMPFAHIKVVDATGKIYLEQRHFQNEQSLDVHQLPSGQYQLLLFVDERSFVVPFVVQ